MDRGSERAAAGIAGVFRRLMALDRVGWAGMVQYYASRDSGLHTNARSEQSWQQICQRSYSLRINVITLVQSSR